MAITKSAKKRIKSSERKKVFNLRRMREMKNQIKDFLKAIQKKEKSIAEELIPAVYKSIDKAVKRGIIKKNNGSRKKSRIMKKISSL